jgi:hypothetical protein
MALSTFYYSNGSPTTSTDITISQSSYNTSLNLTSVDIGDGVTFINNNTFFGRGSLININIPNSVLSIGYSAFRNCYALQNIIIPNQMVTIASETFSTCRSLSSITIPNNIKTIEYSAFYNCTSLTNVNISNGVETISAGAFSTCQSLINITIPKSVINISEAAFYNCTNLNTINIGNVSNIGNDVFRNCFQLTKINFLENVPNSLGTNVFFNTPANLKIYRYSIKSGWSSTFGGKDVLLIDSPVHQGLKTFGFSNISTGKTSIKKQNLNNLFDYNANPTNNIYTFKGGTVNTISTVFNKDEFLKFISAAGADSLRIRAPGDSYISYYVNSSTNQWTKSSAGTDATNIVIDPDSTILILYINPSDQAPRSVNSGAIIQRYNSGKISLKKN